MSDPKKPGDDPFAATEGELSAELDEWDQTFDALTQTGESHFDDLIKKDGDAPSTKSEPAGLPGLPAQTPADDADKLTALFGEGGLDDFAELDDLGTSPQALGSLLGQPPPLMPPPPEDGAPKPEPEPASAQPSRPRTVDSATGSADAAAGDDEDDGLLTSAPKPVLAPAPTDEELFGSLPDKIPDAPVAKREATAKPTDEATRIADVDQALLEAAGGGGDGDYAPEATRIADVDMALLAASAKDESAPKHSPAIVRRDELERLRKEREQAKQRADDSGDDFGGSTRIASAELIENIVDQSESEAARAAAAAAEAFFAEDPPEVQLELDDDFYDDIQIGEHTEAAPAERDPEEQPKRRRTAHIVRRSAPEIPTETQADDGGGVVLEIEAEPSEPYGMIDAERPGPVAGEVGGGADARAVDEQPAAEQEAVEIADELVLGEEPVAVEAQTPDRDILDEIELGGPGVESIDLPPPKLPTPKLPTAEAAPAEPPPADVPPATKTIIGMPAPAVLPVGTAADADAAISELDADGAFELGEVQDVFELGEDDAFDELPTVAIDRDDVEGGTLVGTGPGAPLPAAVDAAADAASDIAAEVAATPAEAPVEEAEPEPEQDLAEVDVEPELPPPVFAAAEPSLDLDALELPEQAEPVTEDQSETLARQLLVYERELELLDEPEALAQLQLYVGRLAEGLGDLDRARGHYEEALAAEPRLIPAMRALRRVEQATGRWVEAVSYLDAELAEMDAEAAGDERRAVNAYRSDLLIASGEQDLARVAVGEVLDTRAQDIPALLANLELAFADGRSDEFETTLQRLSEALEHSALGGAVDAVRGAIAEGKDDRDAAMAAYRRAIQGTDAGRPAFLGLARTLLRAEKYGEAATVLHHIASATGLAETDPGYAAALQWRRHRVAAAAKDEQAASDGLAQSVALVNDDPVVLSALADDAARAGDNTTAVRACLRVAEVAPSAADKAQANWRAARLLAGEDLASPRNAADAMRRVVMLDPADAAATAELEAVLRAAGETSALIEIDRHATAADVQGTLYERLRLADALVAAGQVDEAIAALRTAVAAGVVAPVVASSLIELYRRSGRWRELAEFTAQVAEAEWIDPQEGDRRAARAAERRAHEAMAAQQGEGGELVGPNAETAALISGAIERWQKVAEVGDEHGGQAEAHAACLRLAVMLGEPALAEEMLAASQLAELGPDGFSPRGIGLALRRVALRLSAQPADGEGADDILREVRAQQPGEPRTALLLLIRAVSSERWDDAAALLEERAAAVGVAEAASLRFRAAGFMLECCEDPARTVEIIAPLTEAMPEFGAAQELLETAHRRMDDPSALAADLDRATRPATDQTTERKESFATMVREAELFEYRVGDPAKALDLYTKALALRPNHPIARDGLRRTAIASQEAAPLANLALADLKHADDADDNIAKADAYELLGRIDDEVRGDPSAALLAWESAANADPQRHQLARILERIYARDARWPDLYELYRRMAQSFVSGTEAEADDIDLSADLLWLDTEQARLATRLDRPLAEVLAHYRSAYARDPKQRRALFAIESATRGEGASASLATLQHAIAEYFEGDPRSEAAFLTRAGETYSMLEQWEPAIGCFRSANERLAGYVPALNGWRFAALKAQLWTDVAEVAQREAEAAGSDAQRVALNHLAGVALMDRAMDGEAAIPAFKHVLSVKPDHEDAFVRLRMLYDENGHHDELATLLAQRLAVESSRGAKLELLHSLAELHRNFLSDRDAAKRDLRRALEINPNDLKAVATLSDIAWEQGAWAESAEALIARARLEKQPEVLKHIFYRLGDIYADRLPNPKWALASFQKVLSFDPDDQGALEQLSRLGMTTGDWRLALGACERLIKLSSEPGGRVAHLHRAAEIYLQGFNDRTRAERVLRVALDLDPTSGAALDALIGFYRQAGDTSSMRVHVDRVAAAMRARLNQNIMDGTAYGVLGRALEARQEAGVVGSMAVAQCAGELAKMLGAEDDSAARLAALAARARPRVLGLGKPNVDDLLFPASVPSGLRQIWSVLGDRLDKHVGVDVRRYGVGRGDRLAKDRHPVAQIVSEVAKDLGIADVEIYVSKREPLVAVAEPTHPVSLVLGEQLISVDRPATIRFAAGRALKLAASSLAVPARMELKDFTVLLVALLRQFHPEVEAKVNAQAVAAEQQRMRRLIPSRALQELSPYATAVAGRGFDPARIWVGIAQGGNRAGLLAAGSIAAALEVASKMRGKADLSAAAADPILSDLLRFAVSDDHARLRATVGSGK